ncbi:MAG: CDP-alcohol phosphatidyltransferase family protein, partial [Coriobacteriia bacterium]|nr:CDP-alcohol phosphatidyltransferase family protein [Coriobacteriia bacterium]
MAATQSSVSTSATTVGPVGHQPGTPENPLHTILTVPNVITLCRLFLTIVFLVLYPISELRTPAIVIFIIAASTDWLDGQVARRTLQVS